MILSFLKSEIEKCQRESVSEGAIITNPNLGTMAMHNRRSFNAIITLENAKEKKKFFWVGL